MNNKRDFIYSTMMFVFVFQEDIIQGQHYCITNIKYLWNETQTAACQLGTPDLTLTDSGKVAVDLSAQDIIGVNAVSGQSLWLAYYKAFEAIQVIVRTTKSTVQTEGHRGDGPKLCLFYEPIKMTTAWHLCDDKLKTVCQNETGHITSYSTARSWLDNADLCFINNEYPVRYANIENTRVKIKTPFWTSVFRNETIQKLPVPEFTLTKAKGAYVYIHISNASDGGFSTELHFSTSSLDRFLILCTIEQPKASFPIANIIAGIHVGLMLVILCVVLICFNKRGILLTAKGRGRHVRNRKRIHKHVNNRTNHSTHRRTKGKQGVCESNLDGLAKDHLMEGNKPNSNDKASIQHTDNDYNISHWRDFSQFDSPDDGDYVQFPEDEKHNIGATKYNILVKHSTETQVKNSYDKVNCGELYDHIGGSKSPRFKPRDNNSYDTVTTTESERTCHNNSCDEHDTLNETNI